MQEEYIYRSVGELQMTCIEVLVNQSSKMIGLKLFTKHLLNMLLMDSLQV